MALARNDKWIWDFWFAKDGADYHIFYLQADKSLKFERLRHWHVSIGHAVSQDLKTWEILPDALHPTQWANNRDAWDDYTTWTGSIIQHDGLWYMFYTGGRRYEHGLVQRIGLATSKDLVNWEKYYNNPLISSDPQWYEQLENSGWHDVAWRDPCVFRHPETGEFHAYITGRVNFGDVDGRGVIAHASSTDLLNWTVQQPITEPGEFGQLEVPQLVKIGSLYYLLYCNIAEHHSFARRARLTNSPMSGTHYYVSESPFGPFRFLTDEYFAADENGLHYAGKLILDPNGNWRFMAFLHNNKQGEFVGIIDDPYPVTVLDDGRLRVEW
jgi:beta-fructofuranosidase